MFRGGSDPVVVGEGLGEKRRQWVIILHFLARCYVFYYVVYTANVVRVLHIHFPTYRRCPKIVTLDDVRSALVSREEFDVFTNEGLGSQQQLSTTN